ncbi:MAG: tetratricopeptide repeat protein [Chloroflexota bacterium]|nr:tetratricopeptide repeat protein [Chloroflexota bacterium]
MTLVTRVGVEERRTVTALFADLVGSTSLGERTDPEVMRALVGRFFELASAEIRSRGGSVERFSGDAVLGIFGLATAHEDDPERAVRAALAIRDGLDLLRTDASARHEIALDARFGIEAGEVVVGDPFGGGTVATGDPVNVAARLEQRAAPGQIVVGPAVRTASATAVQLMPLGELELKGKDEPITAWLVVAASPELGGARGVPGLSAPLTGRDEELALLIDAGRRAKSGNKVVLFTALGAPGVGKSRLAREAASALSSAIPTTVLRGRCLPYGDGITYWPLGEMLRTWAGIGPELDAAQALERLRAICPDEAVADRLGFAIGLTADAPMAEDMDKEISWAARRLVESLAPAGDLLLLVFEDIHWAEPVLLDLIEYLVAWSRGVPALVLCLARPELMDRRPTWGGGRVESSRIQLEPLGEVDSRRLLGALLAVDDLPESLRARILERAEGNPLFVEEVVRMLIDAGMVVRRDDRWVALGTAADVRVPETIEALIRARLDTLPRPERSLLQTASVVGRVFQRSAVAALVGEQSGLGESLDEAVLRDLITEESGADRERTYRFKHILIRDMAYATLPKTRRAALHLRVVDWLDEWAGDRAEEFIEIAAYHLEQAAKFQRELEGTADPAIVTRAVDLLSRSARRALDRDDMRAGELFAQRALALEPADPAQRLEAKWLFAEAGYPEGDLKRLLVLGPQIVAEAKALGRSDLVGRALLVQALGEWVGPGGAGVAAGRDLIEEAMQVLEAAGDATWLFEATFAGGYVGWWHGDLEASTSAWAKAAAVARQAGDPGREARALLELGNAEGMRGRVEELRPLIERSIDLAREAGRRVQVNAAHRWAEYVTTCVSASDGIELMAAIPSQAEEVGDSDLADAAWWHLGLWRLHLGDSEGALAAAERSLAFTEGAAHGGRIPESEQLVALCLLARGDIAGAEQHASRAAEIVLPEDWATVASTHSALGRVREAQGRFEEAERLLAEAVEVIERTDYVALYWQYQAPLANFLLRQGRVAEGERWLAAARESASVFIPNRPPLAWVERDAAAARAAGQASGHDSSP